MHKKLPFYKRKRTIVLTLAFALLLILLKIIWPYIDLAGKNGLTPSLIISLIKNNPQGLKNFDRRTNVLLLGISGGNHEGATLSDSMTFISLDGGKDAVLISLPRDIWSPTLKDKINSAYAYGEAKRKGGGILLAKAIAEEVVEQPIHYAFVIDFFGFQNLIDTIGGININVPKSFVDEKFPILGAENDKCDGDPEYKCRYKIIRFPKGWQHMNGEKALQYVRSRNADGQEGSDLARGIRQQEVLLAVKDKLYNIENIFDIKKTRSIIRQFQKTIETDMNPTELIIFARTFSDLKNGAIKRPILSIEDPIEGKRGFLLNPPVYEFDNKWVLIPRQGDGKFEEIHEYIKCWIEEKKCTLAP